MTQNSRGPELEARLSTYYRFQSKIYDATRWSFLFGRRTLLRELPFARKETFKILEVGCGTGANLCRLADRYKNASIHGIDLSQDMLTIARKKTAKHESRIQLFRGHYGQVPLEYPYDLIIFSYCLTMVNPGWEGLIDVAMSDLKGGGILGVVDFHNTPVATFERHMAGHHVRMDGHLSPYLKEVIPQGRSTILPAYGGVWNYFQFVGKKPG